MTSFTWSAGQNDFLGSGSGAVTQVNGTGADLNTFSDFVVADVDGDGRSDLVRRYGGSGTGHIQALLWRANGYENRDIYATSGEVAGPDGSVVTPMDLNGDGRADFVVFNPNLNSGLFKACITNTSATALSCTAYPSIARPTSDIFYFGDFNGDGKIDLLIYRGPNTSTFQYQWDLHLGIASGFNTVAARVVTTFSAIAGEYPPSSYAVGDFNGDGRADLISRKTPETCPFPPIPNEPCYNVNDRVTWRVFLSMPGAGNAITFVSPSDEVLATNANTEKNVTYDFNGDGKTDFVSSNSSQAANVVSLSAGSVPDLMTRVTNGMQAYTNIEYAPLTDSSVYTKGTSATAEKIDIQSPMYVVKKTMSSHGNGGTFDTFDTTYSYESLLAQTDGRGLLGFGKKNVSHSNGAAIVRTEMAYYNDVWWRAGRIASVRKYVGGFLVNEAINNYEAKGNSQSNNVYQVHLTSTTERSWNFNGATTQSLPTTVTTTSLANIDDYGNVQAIKVQTIDPATGQPDGYGKDTSSAYYQADTANWIIGRLQTASVTHTMPGNTTTTRKSSFVYDPTTGQLTVEKVEPDENEAAGSSLWLTKSYAYDAYGNITQTDVKFADKPIGGGVAGTTRTTRTKYCTADTRASSSCVIDGRFPTRVEGALPGHVETRGYERTFGNMTESVDPNGIRTAPSFDGFGRKVADALYDSAGNALAFATTTYTPVGVTAGTGYTVENRSHTGGYSRTTFDTLGREISGASRTFGGGEAISASAYDDYGRKAWISGPRGGVGGVSNYLTTTIAYDALGRPIAEVVRAGQNAPNGATQTSTTTVHNVVAEGNRTYATVAVTQSVTDTVNHTVTKYTDSQGRTAKIIDNAAQVTTYGYDPIGNLAQVSGPGAISETMTYDKRGRKVTATNANIAGNYTYVYNGAGELITQADRKSQFVNQQYDAAGRMIGRDEQGISSIWNYDGCTKGIGKLCSTNTGSITHEYVYDAQARPQQVKSTIDNQIFIRTTLYNTKGQMSYVGYPATQPGEQPLGLITTYNLYGFADKVQRPGVPNPYWTAAARYDDGSLSSGTNGAAPYEKDADTLGHLSVVRLKTSQSALLNTSTYTYDKIGNVTSRNQQLVGGAAQDPERFCYDNLNRVTHAAVSSVALDCAATANFAYSVDGNLVTKTGATGAVGSITYGTTTRTNNAGPHAVAAAQSRNYFYDLNGNLEQIRNGDNSVARSISYTPFNLPASIILEWVSSALDLDRLKTLLHTLRPDV